MSTAEEETLVIGEMCKDQMGRVRLVVNGSDGPDSIDDFHAAEFNPDPESPMPAGIPSTCFAGPDGNGDYKVLFYVNELMPGQEYVITVMYDDKTKTLPGQWPTAVGDCDSSSQPPCQ